MDHPFFLRLAYVGTRFHGWQIQTKLRSVQAELWQALRQLQAEAPMPQGTGRTDAGVHARAQGVLVRMARPWDPYRLLAALNAHLPAEVRVMAVQPAPEGFWPRQHAMAKRYTYTLFEGPAHDPFLCDTTWHVRGAARLDRSAIQTAVPSLLGKRDFSSFRHSECAAISPVRTLHAVKLEEAGPLLRLHFEGDRFLMHQVRIMTGTLVEIGKGRMPPEELESVVQGLSRTLAGPTAPPHGLCLEETWYQPAWGIGSPCPWPDTRETS